MNKIKYSRIALNTQLSTKKSEKNTEVTIYDDDFNTVNIDELSKASFTYKGAFPYLVDALSELCTINPKINDEFVIKGQEDKTLTHYSAMLKWDTLTNLATRGEAFAKDTFRKEIMNIFEKPPKLYIKANNGYSVLTNPFIIRSIVYEDLEKMTAQEAEICARLGITKKIAYVDIEFFKPLFNACFPNKEQGGFIYTDPAFWTMFQKTALKIIKDPKLSQELKRFYNPRTNTFILKTTMTYYKFVLYLLTHISSNENSNTLTLHEPQIIELLKHVDPNQLKETKEKTYIKNIFDTKLFFDKACLIYNKMGKFGYSEKTIAVSEHCLYGYENNKLKITIAYTRETPRTKIKDYTSNFIENEIKKQKPLELEYKRKDTF